MAITSCELMSFVHKITQLASIRVDADLRITCVSGKILVEMRAELPEYQLEQQVPSSNGRKGGKPARHRRQQNRKKSQKTTLDIVTEDIENENDDPNIIELEHTSELPEESIMSRAVINADETLSRETSTSSPDLILPTPSLTSVESLPVLSYKTSTNAVTTSLEKFIEDQVKFLLTKNECLETKFLDIVTQVDDIKKELVSLNNDNAINDENVVNVARRVTNVENYLREGCHAIS